MLENIPRNQFGRIKGDEHLIVEFMNEPVEKKNANGDLIWVDTPFVKISIPGDRSAEIFRPVNKIDPHRFIREWEQFQAGEKNEIVGYPVSQAGFLQQGQVRTLKSINVHTVEQLADLRDDICMRYQMSAAKQKAILFLESKKETDLVSKIQAEREANEEKIKAMEQRILEMAKLLEVQPEKKVGRPPKTEV
jgi:hypothetical protein